jgi:soluble lytic murein transglycosylase-like protein
MFTTAHRCGQLACVLLAGIAAAVHAQVFVGIDARGAPVLSNFQSEATPHVLLAAPADATERVAQPAATDPRDVPIAGPGRWSDVIQSVARQTALSPHLLQAVSAVETASHPRAVSRKGAQGLMQLMPDTARRFGVVDPFDPRQNVAGGAAYLKWLLQRFDGDLPLALAAYNAGEAAVIRAGYRIPSFEETRAYVPRVLARLHRASSAY